MPVEGVSAKGLIIFEIRLDLRSEGIAAHGVMRMLLMTLLPAPWHTKEFAQC